MVSFTITFGQSSDPSTATVTCDAYAQEGPMVTFFAFGPDRDTIDPWSRRVASFRIEDIVSVVRHDAASEVRRPSEPVESVPVLVAC